jgi:undecaprenyl pyrophosphate phosphatase UppP
VRHPEYLAPLLLVWLCGPGAILLFWTALGQSAPGSNASSNVGLAYIILASIVTTPLGLVAAYFCRKDLARLPRSVLLFCVTFAIIAWLLVLYGTMHLDL